MTDYKISASILSADFACLGDEVKKVIAAGADSIHIDVMDNHYVPNLTFGPLVCQSLRDCGITAPFDVHLMCKPVDRLIVDFAQAGATQITIHPEATEHLDRSLELIRENNCRAGLAFNPSTPLIFLDHVLTKLDFILIMSVNPGFGGQQFIPDALDKIKAARHLLTTKKLPIRLGVDGGVKKNNIAEIAKAGADTFIMGSAIFQSKDYLTTITEIKKELSQCKT
jgi:ribulose-phosphate 3-epimerase